jgi:hypothetical protein
MVEATKPPTPKPNAQVKVREQSDEVLIPNVEAKPDTMSGPFGSTSLDLFGGAFAGIDVATSRRARTGATKAARSSEGLMAIVRATGGADSGATTGANFPASLGAQAGAVARKTVAP